VTAVLVLLKNAVFSQILHNKINEGSVAQAVYPSREVAQLFEGIVGHIQTILLILAILVIIVAGVGVMVSMYNSMSDRSREIGVMRALGAARVTVMSIVLLEAILLAVLGGVVGVILGHTTIGAFAPVIADNTGVMIHFLELAPATGFGGWSISPELVLIPALILLAVFVGFLPAVVAYRTDVSRALSHSP
jgi:putative ABC transport system permease protein